MAKSELQIAHITAPEETASTVERLRLAWSSWLLGPLVFVYCAAASTGEPNILLATLAVVGHAVSIALTILMVVQRARFRSLPEFWLMVGYWLPLASLFVATAIASRELSHVCLFIVVGWAGFLPICGAVRLFRRR